MYPHTITGMFAARRRNVIRRNIAALPAYSLVLGLIALLGYMALAAPGVPAQVKAHDSNAQLACRSCSSGSSRAGSRASPSPRS